MDRCGVNRFEGLFQDFLQSSDFANPGRSRLLPPMAVARLPMPGSDFMAERPVGLIKPLGAFVAEPSRNLRQTERHRVKKSFLKRLPDLALLLA